jgi:beta-lactam-binding protein with PASTA domain
MPNHSMGAAFLRYPITGLVVLAIALGSACGPSFARLDGVLVETRPALPVEFGRVQIIREGKSRAGKPGMGVKPGDDITTAADGVAFLTLASGYEVIFEPGTDATVENTSITMRLGTIIVQTLQEVKQPLSVTTDFASVAVEGTHFVYQLTRDRIIRVAVLEGRLTVYPPGSEAVSYAAGETGTIRAGSAPVREEQLDAADIRAIRRRVEDIESSVHPIVPDLYGEPELAAQALLEERGLVRGGLSLVVTRDVPAGIIWRTSPPAGSHVRSGTPVSLEVADSVLVVPNVLGFTALAAVRELTLAGFELPDTTSQYQPKARSGTVVGVEPAGGTLVSAGTRLMVILARSTPDVPPDSTPPPPLPPAGNSCTVPRLFELSETRALRALRNANLRPGKIRHGESGETVTGQSLPPGRKVKCGTLVDFVIGTSGK